MSATVSQEGRGGLLCIDVAGVTSTDNGGIGAIKNPWGEDVLILRSSWYIGTPSTGATNISIGVASAATGAATDILNALAADGAITGKVYNGHVMQNGAKTEIAAPAVWQDDYYVTFTGSADSTGLVAKLFLECVPLT
mgnify:CR=1 FL=1